jgi:acyl-coenzyme A synthetase/AMP-(fatty) acid ligase
MSAPAPRRASAAPAVALIAHRSAHEIVAYRRGEPVSAARFLADVDAVAASLPDARHVLNSLADRYLFAVALCAAVLREQVTLMPASTTPNVIASLKAFAPDLYVVGDEAGEIDLPHVVVPADAGTQRLDSRRSLPSSAVIGGGNDMHVPTIPADRVVACLFTSGTTGTPRPNFKAWGAMVRNVQAEGRRFGVGPGHTILGTVPAQHMYGFESTVMLALATGAAFTAERLYYPADIDAAIERAPAPRILFTTPFHLKTWMESGSAARLEMLVSATAPLSVALARTAEQRTGAQLHEIYGCTEAGQVASRRPTAGAEWTPFDGIRLSQAPSPALPQGGGSTYVSGGHVAEPTLLHDVIELAGDGTRFLLHGRSADMVNIAGKRNSLAYLNHQLTSIEGVQDGVFFLPDETESDGVTRLTALVVAPGMGAPAVAAELRKRIDAAFMPRPLHIVDALPRQATGKLPREALLALARKLRSP